MISVYLIFCVAFAFIGYFTEKNIFNPVTIMTVLWGSIVYLSRLGWYGLYLANEHTYLMIIIGIYTFVFSYYISKLILKVKPSQSKSNIFQHNNPSKINVNYRVIYFLYLICICYIIIKLSQRGLYNVIGTGFNLASISSDIQSNSNNVGGLISFVGFWIAGPLYFPLMIMSLTDYIFGNKDRWLIFLNIALMSGRILLYGGRYPFIQLVIAIILLMSFKYHHKYNLKSTARYFLVLVIGLLVFTMLTNSKTKAPLETVYLDFAMQPIQFQTWAEVIDLSDSYSYGFASVFGFVHPFLYVIENLNGNGMPTFFSNIYNNIQNTFNIWIPIGNTLNANAYTSIFWYLYYDGRIIGIILGMLIFGMVACLTYNRAYDSNNPQKIANYIMVAFCLIYTFTDMEMYKYDFALGLIYVNVLIFNKYGMYVEENDFSKFK